MSQKQKIKIKYVGPSTIREMDAYRWDEGNGYVEAVPVQKAAELLTYPRPDFVLADDQDVDAAQEAIEAFINPAKGQETEA